jgi:hypothetical protein
VGTEGPDGMTQSERFVCTSREQGNIPSLYQSCNLHIAKANASKKDTTMTRLGDVIAGGAIALSTGMEPCQPLQRQPPGIFDGYI